MMIKLQAWHSSECKQQHIDIRNWSVKLTPGSLQLLRRPALLYIATSAVVEQVPTKAVCKRHPQNLVFGLNPTQLTSHI